MTTVIAHQGSLIADRQLSVPYAIPFTKIQTHDHPEKEGRLLATVLVGDTANAIGIREWFLGIREDFDFDIDHEGMLVIFDSDCIRMVQSNEPVFYEFSHDEIYANGSGAQFALGAFAMKASIAEAMEVAAKYDPGTGFGYDRINVTDLTSKNSHAMQYYNNGSNYNYNYNCNCNSSETKGSENEQ